MRPRYESVKDREREEMLMAALAKRWDCTYIHLKEEDRLDYTLYDEGELAGYCEIKCRYNDRMKYPTLFISNDKIVAAKRRCKNGLFFVLVIWWDDGVGIRLWRGEDLVGYNPKVRMGGNYQRNDGMGDVEPMAHIPLSEFRKVNGKKFE